MKVDVFLSCALLLAEDQTLLNSRIQWCTFTMSCDFFFFYHNKCLLLKQNYGCVLVFGLLSHTYFLNSLWRWILSKDILYGTVKKKMLLVITAYRIMPYLSCCVNFFPHNTLVSCSPKKQPLQRTERWTQTLSSSKLNIQLTKTSD